MPFTLETPDAIQRTRERDGTLNAYITKRLEDAQRDWEHSRDESPRSPLHGISYGLKDEWETTVLPTTAGSARHRHRIPSVSSPVYEVFNDAGAILLGKTNLSDMGLAPEATSYVGGSTRNPFDLSRTAGGSSGGSAAVVADGMAAFDWGTDIGGSIRLPAAYCGIYGLKLSSATWPVQGLFPRAPKALEWMLSQGPLTRNLDEMKAVLEVAAQRLRLSTSTFEPTGAVMLTPVKAGEWPSFVSEVEPLLRQVLGKRVAHGDRRMPNSNQLQRVFIEFWSAHLEDLLEADDAIPSIFHGLRAVMSSLLLRGRFGDKRFHPITAELLAAIAVGRATVFRDKRRARARATAIQQAATEIWNEGTVLVAPVSVYKPPKVGRSNRNPRLLANTVLGNLADATILTLPFTTFSKSRLPRAVQIMGPPGSEDALLELGERLIEAGMRLS